MKRFCLFYATGLGLCFLPSVSFADVVKKQDKQLQILLAAPTSSATLIHKDKKERARVKANKKDMDKSSKKKKKKDEKTEVKIIDIDMRAKYEFFNLRNKRLRRSFDRENKQEMEPSFRINAHIMKGNPIYGRIELELKNKIKQETGGKSSTSETKLQLNQAYLGLTEKIIPNTHLRLGRWLYRDEREWLFDENLDGIHAQWQRNKWQIDALGGRVNYWQKDLLDRASRNTSSVDIGGVIMRHNLDKDWNIGGYAIVQNNGSTGRYRLNHYGLRSHSTPKEGLRHWFELGMVEGHNTGKNIDGYTIDAGGTYIFLNRPMRPRLTLGYAFGSKKYRQTGLNSNEATFGGKTKFKIYGETLNPELTNMHVLTAGFGMDITTQATIDFVYHRYEQANLTKLSENEVDLSSKYDKRNQKYLGTGLDMILGWSPRDNIVVEGRLGAFIPSDRFRATKKKDSLRAENAYSIGLEVAFSFF